ncbi:sensor histidine kinase [Fodinibius saliphilus]|uniref:sensor histidine kinase n=1 Tax=Fodinibius saliphilus TaxID=1920650 RepID=UPI001108E9EC|nr:ATP-binding protein [Fodinibius saliphilus]
MEDLSFKISSALKDIIGRDLITDDHIAVFELVKNSYDAYATRVDITFENIYSENSKIIIKDNGKGMGLEDIKNKWLFVAYSAKKEGTEDDSFDYRDNIYQKRAFAGAKGIGRFSCDRLGKELLLESTKKEKDAKTEVIVTDWTLFEEDLQDEFINVTIQHETRDESYYGLEHGTVLEITDLRSDWDRKKLLRLKRSLAKLINPTNDEGSQSFKIFLNVPEEKEQDRKEEDYRKRVNGEIQNRIFDTLEIKTTKIKSYISEDKEYITTELLDGGTLIYKVEEKNPYKKLYDISVDLFYLNRSAKVTFTRRMGLRSKEYGHVFIYKNGFRIYPYGEPGEDPLKIDARKAQGFGRYLGTRELIGQININSDNDELRETTSRGDGLIKTKAYEQLESFFWDTLKRLEKYVVDVQKWGLSIEKLEDEDLEQDEKTFQDRISKLIADLSGNDNLIDFEYGDKLLEQLEEAQSESTETLLGNLEKLAEKKKNEDLLKDVKKVNTQVKELKKAKSEAEKKEKEERNKRVATEEKLEEKESQNLFLKSVKSQDFDEVISFIHHMGISASKIDNILTALFNKLRRGKELSHERIQDLIKQAVFENKKIMNISQFATKANFKLYTDAIEINIGEYLREYISNIVDLYNDDGVEISFKNKTEGNPKIFKTRPIELNILVDNMLSNSKKAGASKFEVRLENEGSRHYLVIEDDGKGIPEDKINEITEYGYTSNKGGSGIGLYHIKEIIDRMNAELKVKSKINEGTKFKIFLP